MNKNKLVYTINTLVRPNEFMDVPVFPGSVIYRLQYLHKAVGELLHCLTDEQANKLLDFTDRYKKSKTFGQHTFIEYLHSKAQRMPDVTSVIAPAQDLWILLQQIQKLEKNKQSFIEYRHITFV